MRWIEALIALSLKVRHLIAGDIVILFSSEGGQNRFSLYSFFPAVYCIPCVAGGPCARLNDTLYAQGCTNIGEPTRALICENNSTAIFACLTELFQ